MHILIAEDSKSSRDVIKHLINKQITAEISEAPNGIEALEIIKSVQVDILISDIKMPLMDGLELIENVSKIKPEMQIIILSAFGNFGYAKKAMQTGVTDYLLKPINPEEFNKTLAKVIKKTNVNRNDFIWTQFENAVSHSNADVSLPYPLSNYSCLILLFPTDRSMSDCIDISAPIKKQFNNSAIKHCSNGNILILAEKCSDFDANKLYNELSKYIICSAYTSDFSMTNSSIALSYNTLLKYAADDFFWELPPANHMFYEERNNFAATSSLIRRAESLGRSITETKTDISDKIEDFFRLMNNNGLSALQCKYAVAEMIKNMLEKISSGFSVSTIIDDINACTKVSILKSTLINFVDGVFDLGLCDSNEHCQNQIVQAALQIIHNEYMNDINRDNIAAKLYISPSYFSHLFKTHTGKGFTSYLNNYRLNKAADLLLKTNRSVSHIAKAVGFINYSYFCAKFKEKFNMTCIEYRKFSM